MFKKHRFETVRKELEALLGPENIFTDAAELLMYSYDAGLARAKPEAVARFTLTEQVAPAVKILYAAGIPYLPRLAGTNLSGGTIPLKGGVILNLSLLNKIRQIDTVNKVAVVEPGVVNLRLQQELDKFGFFYAPDPSSQKVSTIGGNIGENAGGPLCLKYGVTADNVERLEVVTPEGSVKRWSYLDPGPDLMSLIIGSEGTLGIVTRAWLKIIEKPKLVKTAVAAFPSIENAITAVTGIISSGIAPRALEAMDKMSLSAAKKTLKTDYPAGSEAILIIELDGAGDKKINQELRDIEYICRAEAAVYFKTAAGAEEREALWQARKGAYPAMARLAPNVLVEDGVVPRPRLPQALKETREILSKYKLTAGLLFHAGDGNLHPNIVFDERDLQEGKRVRKAGYEILKSCIRLGGSISGEHGIGVEKRVAMNWMYDARTLDFFAGIKKAFDPADLANPDKILPVACDHRAGLRYADPAPFGDAAAALVNDLLLRARSGIPSAVTGLGTKLKKNRIMEGLKTAETSALNRVLELDRANFTVKAEAGISVRELKRSLKDDGFEIALPDLEGSLGGAIAAKTWPPLRNLILGMDIALADGAVLTLGGKIVKNVAGYDALKLLCGSLGAYAVILTVTLKTALRSHSACGGTAGSESGFEPDEYHCRLKKAFDPRNLLNPWMYGRVEGRG
ncbi:MAG: FAD-binding protein [Elusimicrobia bacterium]|nr:FAD-binding protein [Elusimicrobiota bacterium]